MPGEAFGGDKALCDARYFKSISSRFAESSGAYTEYPPYTSVALSSLVDNNDCGSVAFYRGSELDQRRRKGFRSKSRSQVSGPGSRGLRSSRFSVSSLRAKGPRMRTPCPSNPRHWLMTGHDGGAGRRRGRAFA